MYTIGEVAEMFSLPVSTLRYYDKEGFFPHMERRGGKRIFSVREIEALRIIECLKRSGMEIKDIRQFMQWCEEGSETYPQRRELFSHQRERLDAEIARLQHARAILDYKCWYYDRAMADGNEEYLHSLTPDKVPEELRQAFMDIHAE